MEKLWIRIRHTTHAPKKICACTSHTVFENVGTAGPHHWRDIFFRSAVVDDPIALQLLYQLEELPKHTWMRMRSLA
eukprot:gene4906-biopygen5283